MEEIEIAGDEKTVIDAEHISAQTPAMRARIFEYYGRKAEEADLAPAADVDVILDKILEMREEEALEIICKAIVYHRNDPNFPDHTMSKLKRLALGYKVADMEHGDWSFDIRTEACMLHWHSPYPEVRSVTDPFDDPEAYVETPRAYFLGMCFMAGATALNTFFSPRQPSISLGAIVLQLLLAPCGFFCARFLPNWSLTIPKFVPIFGECRWALNPGPWSYKEQMFATIMFTVSFPCVLLIP